MGTMKIWDIRTFECVQTMTLDDCKGANSFTPITCNRCARIFYNFKKYAKIFCTLFIDLL